MDSAAILKFNVENGITNGIRSESNHAGKKTSEYKKQEGNGSQQPQMAEAAHSVRLVHL